MNIVEVVLVLVSLMNLLILKALLGLCFLREQKVSNRIYLITISLLLLTATLYIFDVLNFI